MSVLNSSFNDVKNQPTPLKGFRVQYRIHELCHMPHQKHNRAFYKLLASKLPQWQRLKTELELSLLG